MFKVGIQISLFSGYDVIKTGSTLIENRRKKTGLDTTILFLIASWIEAEVMQTHSADTNYLDVALEPVQELR